jgi:hypothetical protein
LATSVVNNNVSALANGLMPLRKVAEPRPTDAASGRVASAA